MRDDTDLARLAREGRERIEKEARRKAEEARSHGNTHVRVALGVHYGSPRKRVSGVIMALGIVGTIATASAASAVDSSVPGEMVILPLFLTFYGALALGLLQPTASESRVVAEHAYVEDRPYRVTGYFESLSITPMPKMTLSAQLTFAGEVPPTSLVRDIVGRVDTQATVEPMGSGLLVQSGPISGVTGIRSGGVWIHRNHMIVPWVHAFLDEVAAPLHARYPLAQVDFDRLV
ncbi:MAG: hypothetical protein GXY23_10540 [Myxococcales bacterium]|nr:hypothetical protein [Myxococcales bacterium]